jgi:hypothetical protein
MMKNAKLRLIIWKMIELLLRKHLNQLFIHDHLFHHQLFQLHLLHLSQGLYCLQYE